MLNINLLDWRSAEYAKRKKRFFAMLGFVVIMAGFLIIFVYLFLVARLHHVGNDNLYLQQKIAELTVETAPAKNFLVRENLAKKTINFINQIEQNRDVPIRLLAALAKIPASLRLTSFLYQDNKLTLEGLGESTDVDQFVKTMQQNDALFTQVVRIELQIAQGVKGNSALQPFKIIATVRTIQ
jgi:Tfp pilus assembly protein PilN